MKITKVDHPLLEVSLTELRNKYTPSVLFRRSLFRAGLFIASEALKRVTTKSCSIETPLTATMGSIIPEESVVLVPILRAGLGFLDPFLELIPNAKVGHIGLSRDHHTLESKEYYRNVPDLFEADLFVLDPMLATGHSAAAALNILSNTNRKPRSITLVTLLCAPEGVAAINESHPEVSIYTGSIDDKLNEKGYIVPGLGDAGDRFFGTV